MKNMVICGLTKLTINGSIRIDQLSNPGSISKKRYLRPLSFTYGISISVMSSMYHTTFKAKRALQTKQSIADNGCQQYKQGSQAQNGHRKMPSYMVDSAA